MAVSRLALPVMSLYSVALWLAILATEFSLWPVFLLFCIGVYLVVELNNRNALMRQYSRMVSCSYMAMMMMCPWVLRNHNVLFVQVCLIASLLLLFRIYQRRESAGTRYYSYLLVGIASMVWPPLLYVVPLLFFCEAAFLYSFSWKGFFISLFAIATPMWLALPYVAYTGTFQEVIDHFAQVVPNDKLISAFSNPVLLIPSAVPLELYQAVVVILIIAVMIAGVVHYVRNSYADKIQVRMYYNLFILMSLVITLAYIVVMLLPFDKTATMDMLLAILIVFVSPLVAHYITFTNTRLTNISVILLMIVVLTLTVYNYSFLKVWTF